MKTKKNMPLVFPVLLIISLLFVQKSFAEDILYKAPAVGTLLEYEVSVPNEDTKTSIYLEVIFRSQNFVVYKRTLSYASEVSHFAEYKGFVIAPCGSKIASLKNDIKAADALWPLKDGNSSQSGDTSYKVSASVLKNKYFPEQQDVFQIEETGKEGKLVYSFSPKFNVPMHLLWNDGSEETLTKISTPPGEEKNKTVPESCKTNIPQWFWN